MGRRDIVPSDTPDNVKLRMERLQWVGGDYDQWGAYWGRTDGTSIYCAWSEDAPAECVQVFVRAVSRQQAKEKVTQLLHQQAITPRFYR